MNQAVLVKIVNKSDNELPHYSSEGAFAMDIRSNEFTEIHYGETKVVKTGLFVELPENTALRIVPRSGLASKGILIANSPGTIDEDYRGEIGIIMTNLSKVSPYKIQVGDRIAQCYLEQKLHFTFVNVDALSETKRGDGGFGSTGIK
jgi:dUTP pyrophosphatase